MSKQFLKEVSRTRAKDLLKMGRSRVGTLIRIVTGHNGLNYFKNKVDQEWDPECRFCNEDAETFWHFATECPVFWNERMDAFGEFRVNEYEWKVAELMTLAD